MAPKIRDGPTEQSEEGDHASKCRFSMARILTEQLFEDQD
jgi:hypothetical protein